MCSFPCEHGATSHTLYTDQPAENGGWDETMTPPEIFLSAVGACAAFYVVAYLKKKGLPYEGRRWRSSPAGLGEIRVVVHAPSELARSIRLASTIACITVFCTTHSPIRQK